jgi:radical SAM superfamily enzyme YgiQ (UPF0313 family)
MRAALVNPPDTFEPDNHREHAPEPLGICYIAAYAREHGHDVDLYDLAEYPSARMWQAVAAPLAGYPVVGLTSYTKTFPAALALARWIRRRNPRARIVLGGPHATPCAEEILTEHDEIDYIVKNDGELPFTALLDELAGPASRLDRVPSLVWRSDGTIVSNPLPTGNVVLDDYPFPRRTFAVGPVRDMTKKLGGGQDPAVCLVSSRGCPKRCTFCSIIVMNPRWRARSTGNMLTELAELRAERDFTHITFMDANFFVDYRRAVEFSDALYAWDRSVTWSGTATVDHVSRHPEQIAAIAKNCAYLEVGLESGCQSVLDRFGKRTTVEHNLRAIEILRATGIGLDVDFIMYDPWTSLDELHENRRFLDTADLLGYWPADLLFNPLKLYPGTAAQRRAIEFFRLEDRRQTELLAPFVHEPVEYVYRTMSGFRDLVYDRVAELPQLLDGAVRARRTAPGDPVSAVTAQRMQSAMIRLRHSSYLAFDEVLAAAAMPRHTRPGPGDLAATRATLPLARAARELLGLDNEEVQV